MNIAQAALLFISWVIMMKRSFLFRSVVGQQRSACALAKIARGSTEFLKGFKRLSGLVLYANGQINFSQPCGEVPFVDFAHAHRDLYIWSPAVKLIFQFCIRYAPWIICLIFSLRTRRLHAKNYPGAVQWASVAAACGYGNFWPRAFFFLIRKINERAMCAAAASSVFVWERKCAPECLFAQLELCIHFSFSWSPLALSRGEDVNKARIIVSVPVARTVKWQNKVQRIKTSHPEVECWKHSFIKNECRRVPRRRFFRSVRQ